MSSEFKLPELGENVESGTVAKILVSEGDTIKKEQAVIELETEKAALEVPSDVGGTIEKILISEGDEVKVGQVILELGDKKKSESEKEEEEPKEIEEKPTREEKKEEVQEEEPATPKPQQKPSGGEIKEVTLPELGENVESGTVAKILVAAGDHIEIDQNFVELETEKAALEVPSEVSGEIKEIFVNEGDEVKVGQKIMSVAVGKEEVKEEVSAKKEETGEKTEQSKPEKESKKTTTKEDTSQTPSAPKMPVAEEKPTERKELAPAAPSVRRFAREIGIDINEVPGTGPSGRISIDDVKNYAKTVNKQRAASREVLRGVQPEPLPDFSKWGEVERKTMSKVREKTATHLGYAWATIAHVTQHDKADITEMEKFRKQYGKRSEAAGGKLTATAILLKITASALKVFPKFNASIDMQNNEIIYKKYYNVGVAVDTDRGLLVPVIREVDKKNIIDLSVELTEIAKKARDKKLSLEEMQGGNFSISNLGGIGGTAFTPIVHSPEVAILGVSRAKNEPVYIEGEFKPRLMLPLSLSYDHRIIDGADAARFLRWVCEAIEQPFVAMLEG